MNLSQEKIAKYLSSTKGVFSILERMMRKQPLQNTGEKRELTWVGGLAIEISGALVFFILAYLVILLMWTTKRQPTSPKRKLMS